MADDLDLHAHGESLDDLLGQQLRVEHGPALPLLDLGRRLPLDGAQLVAHLDRVLARVLRPRRLDDEAHVAHGVVDEVDLLGRPDGVPVLEPGSSRA